MLSIMLTIGEKILILFLMIALGVILAKKGKLSRTGVSQLTDLVLMIATPCIIINSFINNLSNVKLGDMILIIIFAVFIHIVGIVLQPFFFRKEPEQRRKVLRFAIVYGNLGFMGLPLLESILGGDGVIYASVFITVFNIFCWTHGVRVMGGGGESGSFLKCLINPGTIGLTIGLGVLLLHIPVPNAVGEVLKSLADVNTPLAMICIGFHISAISPRQLVNDRAMLLSCGLRLILVPLITLIFLFFIVRDYAVFASVLLQAAMPAAANTALFADKYNGDRTLASQAVALSTLCSILTLPIFAAIARMICQ